MRTDEEWRALCRLVPGLSDMASLDLGQRIAARASIDEALTALGHLSIGIHCR